MKLAKPSVMHESKLENIDEAQVSSAMKSKTNNENKNAQGKRFVQWMSIYYKHCDATGKKKSWDKHSSEKHIFGGTTF